MPIPPLAAAVAFVVALGLPPALLPSPGPGPDPPGAQPGPMSAAVGSATLGSLPGREAGTGPMTRPGSTSWSGIVSAGRWVWPLDPVPTIVRQFEPPPEPWAAGHRGVDLLGTAGQPVLAAGDGVVSFSGVVAGRGVVTVRHADGWRTTYEPVDDRVAEGTRVRPGERIGALDPRASHCAPRVCLHWGALAGPRDYRDPLALLGLVRPVLLPWS